MTNKTIPRPAMEQHFSSNNGPPSLRSGPNFVLAPIDGAGFRLSCANVSPVRFIYKPCCYRKRAVTVHIDDRRRTAQDPSGHIDN